MIVRSKASEQRVHTTLQRQVEREQQSWEKRLWHVQAKRFACEADARAVLEESLPLFLASSVFVKKPERIVALGFIMVLCLLVYRFAECRLRSQLAQAEQTLPNQIHKPTSTPTMRWIFQCFEGIDLLRISTAAGSTLQVLHLRPFHEQVLMLLGPPYLKFYQSSP